MFDMENVPGLILVLGFTIHQRTHPKCIFIFWEICHCSNVIIYINHTLLTLNFHSSECLSLFFRFEEHLKSGKQTLIQIQEQRHCGFSVPSGLFYLIFL